MVSENGESKSSHHLSRFLLGKMKSFKHRNQGTVEWGRQFVTVAGGGAGRGAEAESMLDPSCFPPWLTLSIPGLKGAWDLPKAL